MSVLLVIDGNAAIRPLATYGTAVALAEGESLHVVRRSVGQQTEPHDRFTAAIQQNVADAAAGMEKASPELSVSCMGSGNWREALQQEAIARNATIAVIPDSFVSVEDDASWLHAFPRATGCPVLVLKTTPDARPPRHILVPAAGGPHAPAALRLGGRIATVTSGEAVCLTVESVDDQDAEAIALHNARRIVERAGLDHNEHVQAEGIASSDPRHAIVARARGRTDLLLLGATEHGAVYRKLFGILPEALMRGEDAISIGIVHSSPGKTQRLLANLRVRIRAALPRLERDVRVQVFERIREGSKLGLDFGILLTVSATIAALGLVQNSAAVVIGAMLVAPLMTPMIGFALALAQANARLARDCTISVAVGTTVAVGMTALLGVFVRVLSLDAGPTQEMLARCGPNVLDLGVAFCSGLAGAYAMAKPKLAGAVAGVAIAAALVPPLSTTGLLLVFGGAGAAHASATLFGVNLVAIVLGAFVAFRLVGIGGGTRSGSGRFWAARLLTAFCLAAVAFMLWLTLGLVRTNASDAVALAQIESSIVAELHDSDLVPLRVKSFGAAGKDLVVVLTPGREAVTGGDLESRLAERLRRDFHRVYNVRVEFVRTLGETP